MGNCQAIDAAALVIQHPNGRIDRLYWPVSASEVMKMNPGHYVSLIIPLPVSEEGNQQEEQKAAVRFTRVKLLRSNDTLTLGHAYRLVTTQEVVNVLRAKKSAKMKKQQPETAEKSQTKPERPSLVSEEEGKPDKEKTYQAMRHERQRTRTTPMNPAAIRSKSWRPSLQSISEAAI
ncbi:uncharacterized protein LOC112024767 [Quercus suber]|uniref:Uncharacterized protein n=1 Tax=Quercus suber TaxID=58331 RepID=A0AAW0K590_QUESU|nr:uncharacterized protein LOC112024767 [Quercus suber]POF25923.1 hypothetical protein CFP56_37925 [Quercus suber]